MSLNSYNFISRYKYCSYICKSALLFFVLTLFKNNVEIERQPLRLPLLRHIRILCKKLTVDYAYTVRDHELVCCRSFA
ncbi:hypothetical protein Ctaglu_09000 [Clostridium tagluense]|uniref:Uncharacterized protein n=1 Tax=Clostridium tagluense TaxID=360422 RepID=A0A401UIA0_9CLOT|nr:hypothetical protein Ctaglu_09000 [Clostridium tagluense]